MPSVAHVIGSVSNDAAFIDHVGQDDTSTLVGKLYMVKYATNRYDRKV